MLLGDPSGHLPFSGDPNKKYSNEVSVRAVALLTALTLLEPDSAIPEDVRSRGLPYPAQLRTKR